MLFGNKLNATIAKVQVFIQDLEEGVAANKQTISQNNVEAEQVTTTEMDRIAEVQAKAAAKRLSIDTKTGALEAQNDIATKLLSNFK